MGICLDSPGNGGFGRAAAMPARMENGGRRPAGCALCLVNGLVSGADLVKRG